MTNLKAEVIAVGDELVSGQRLDTNTQWISQQFGELGMAVGFHSTIGDDLADHVEALKIAAKRADIVVMTGGLGPTSDDLTREAMAQAANLDLEVDEKVLAHIEGMYARRGYTMPENNRVQAYFPVGAKIINNPEGTAPGIDLLIPNSRNGCRFFALPGVPVEMKQMWAETIEPELKRLLGDVGVIHHHTLHCFGLGESAIETMLPDLIKRGRDPQVGITASSATISLRVSTRAESQDACLEKMQPTITAIHQNLGDLVFGENGQTLDEVVFELLDSLDQTIAISDAGLGGEVANRLSQLASPVQMVKDSRVSWATSSALDEATHVRNSSQSDFGLAIERLDDDETKISEGESRFEVAIVSGGKAGRPPLVQKMRYGGHSAWRRERAIKQVLNLFRLYCLGQT